MCIYTHSVFVEEEEGSSVDAHTPILPPPPKGTCVDGWWVFVNTSDQDVIISKADANFGLRTLGNSPRDNGPPRKDHQE